MRRSSAEANSASGLLTTADRSACENSRPMTAPICATSFAGRSRSSRAMSDACKLAGTAGDGTAAAVHCAAPSLPASNTALVISSTKSGMPSVRSMISWRILAGSDLFPTTRSIMVLDVALRQPIDGENRHVRPAFSACAVVVPARPPDNARRSAATACRLPMPHPA